MPMPALHATIAACGCNCLGADAGHLLRWVTGNGDSPEMQSQLGSGLCSISTFHTYLLFGSSFSSIFRTPPPTKGGGHSYPPPATRQSANAKTKRTKPLWLRPIQYLCTLPGIVPTSHLKIRGCHFERSEKSLSHTGQDGIPRRFTPRNDIF
jgi:hypothetical protein